MSDRRHSRRAVFEALSAAAAGAAMTRGATAAEDLAPATRPAGAAGSVRLGGPVFVKTDDPAELAAAHRAIGYRAAYCPNVKLDDRPRIAAFTQAFARHDVVIAEVGRWCNLMEADPEKRAANLARVTEGLALAEEIGARCCVDIAGSFSTESWFGPHPDNLTDRHFDAAVENARKIIDAVKPRRARFCYEMMGWAHPDSPDGALRMLKAVDRPGFGIHLDVANLVNSPVRFYRNTDLIHECFDKLGPWIVSCHAKDLVWDVEMNIHFREVPPGRGELDLSAYVRRLGALKHEAPLMIEHCANEAEYDQARRHILGLGRAVEVSFE